MKLDKEMKLKFKKFGLHIRKLREERNLNIKELSEKTGIRKEYLKKIENGTAYGMLLEKHLTKISTTLNISLYQLFEF